MYEAIVAACLGTLLLRDSDFAFFERGLTPIHLSPWDRPNLGDKRHAPYPSIPPSNALVP